MRRRSRQIIHGLGCLILLLAIALAPPVLLIGLVGWPLPTTVPSLEVMDSAIRSGIADATIVKGLACLAWLAWAQVMLAVLIDIASVARGGLTPQVPVLPGIQVATGRLVAGATMLLSLLAPGPRVAGAMPVARPPAIEMVLPSAAAPVARSVLAEPAPHATLQAEDKTWVVQRHDSYWSIAERTLGDGLRWREIRDANVGRQMPDGQTVTAQSDTIAAGWTLLLPADATVEAAPAPADPPTANVAPDGLVVAQPGDSLWLIAEDRVGADLNRLATDAETSGYWTDLVGANQQLDDPDFLRVGEPVHLPASAPVASAADEPPPIATPPAVPETVPPAPPVAADVPVDQQPTSVTTEPAPADSASEGEEQTHQGAGAPTRSDDGGVLDEAAIVGLLGITGAGIAVGAARAVRRRRRTRHHRPDRPATRAPAETRQAHRIVLAAASDDGVTVDRLRLELDALAIAVAAGGQTCRPRVVQLASDHIDVVLDRTSVPAPPGWRAEASGTAWVKDELEPSIEGGPECFATPLLVAIGSPDDNGQLHLDLEAEGLVTLLGDEEAIDGLVRSWVTELATTTLAENIRIHVIGDVIADDLMLHDRVQHFDSWDGVMPDLRARGHQAADLLAANQWPTTFAARGAGSDHDALAPLVVVGTPPDDLAGLRVLHDSGLGAVAVVLVGAVDVAGTEVRCEEGSVSLPAIGLVCAAQTLSSEAAAALAALVSNDEDLSSEAEQLSLLESEPPGPPARSLRKVGPYEDPDHDVLVRLLGNISVIGGNRPLPGKHAAVVAYIALHGKATPGALIDAVWSGVNNPNRRKRLANIISECRSALGAQHLPQAADGIYRAGPGLVTDTELFNRRVAYAATQAPSEAAVTLQGALDLVEDVVFTYQRADHQSFSWIDLDGLQEIWGQKVANVADALIGLHLEAGDTSAAIAVATSTLAVLPGDANLTEQLMRAHHAAGDRLAVQRTYIAHLAVLDALEFDAPEESTVELHDRLVG